MKACPICAHRFHIPGKCMGPSRLVPGGACPCVGPQSAEIPLEQLREMQERKSKRRRSLRLGDKWENDFISIARRHGYWVTHTDRTKTASGSFRSAIKGDKNGPDTWCVSTNPARPDFFAAELKAGQGKVTREQREVHEHLRRAGITVYVWRPEDVDEINRRLARGHA